MRLKQWSWPVGVGMLAVVLTGCSLNTVIWGADGAEVIDATEKVIAAASAGDGATFVCAGAEPEMGGAADWAGLAPEEPERFVAEYWPEAAAMDPAWSINLSLPEDRITNGMHAPSDIFYQQANEGLCVVHVEWSTIEGVG